VNLLGRDTLAASCGFARESVRGDGGGLIGFGFGVFSWLIGEAIFDGCGPRISKLRKRRTQKWFFVARPSRVAKDRWVRGLF
jgi:hypothetical protein